MDVLGGVHLTDGTEVKVVTGIDDNSRFVVSAKVVARATARPVCEALLGALRRYGVPEQVLTDNGKVFTGRFGRVGRARRCCLIGSVPAHVHVVHRANANGAWAKSTVRVGVGQQVLRTAAAARTRPWRAVTSQRSFDKARMFVYAYRHSYACLCTAAGRPPPEVARFMATRR